MIEIHEDDLTKAHVYGYTHYPIPKRSSDSISTTMKLKIDTNVVALTTSVEMLVNICKCQGALSSLSTISNERTVVTLGEDHKKDCSDFQEARR